MTDNYEIFGLDENCSDEELTARYNELRAKYSEDRFLEGEAGNIAARKLTELDMAYSSITSSRREKQFSFGGGANAYSNIEDAIKRGDLTEAQNILDSFNERNAEWHYLQSVVFYKKNWSNESKKQLEIAIEMDPSNSKYKNSYDKLCAKMDSDANKNFTSYNGNPNQETRQEDRQMGGNGCLEWCCEMAVCNMLLNCCCNCR